MSIDPADPHDFRTAADELRAGMRTGDCILINGSDMGIWFLPVMYMGLDHYLRPIPVPVIMLEAPPNAEQLRSLGRFDRVWLVSGQNARPVVQLLFRSDIPEPAS